MVEKQRLRGTQKADDEVPDSSGTDRVPMGEGLNGDRERCGMKRVDTPATATD